MPYTMIQAEAGVRMRLRRPSEQKLPPKDVRKVLMDVLRGYVQDIDLGGRDQRTDTREVQIVEDDTDFLLQMPDVPDFEAVRLEYNTSANPFDEWPEALLVPFDAWPSRSGTGRVVASIYGSSVTQEGTKLKLNLAADTVALYSWRLSYRLPLLAVVQSGERPPIPENFMPMLEDEAAIKCAGMVSDDTEGWKAWKAENLPLLIADLREWKERWEHYLSRSLEPQEQPLRRSDQFRINARPRSTRGYLPRQ